MITGTTTTVPTTSVPTTSVPTTSVPTTSVPTTSVPTTPVPTTSVPTTPVPTTSAPTTISLLPIINSTLSLNNDGNATSIKFNGIYDGKDIKADLNFDRNFNSSLIINTKLTTPPKENYENLSGIGVL